MPFDVLSVPLTFSDDLVLAEKLFRGMGKALTQLYLAALVLSS